MAEIRAFAPLMPSLRDGCTRSIRFPAIFGHRHPILRSGSFCEGSTSGSEDWSGPAWGARAKRSEASALHAGSNGEVRERRSPPQQPHHGRGYSSIVQAVCC